eukprot:CAMPEP_0119106726 /NCGR_PEP_ID=MMETSP1180-20130426/6284_1 /TAXON_ID=3052 ORGANISM="Chlamydomonas cf sp, Strain CCMP681" /NCGR_SAMPLE_ID=MMETSP1180 /ASSEMBLY_ACC=CAM_ASM_000741 /LENGTH=470 /DNA_ID=CAMNT_0007092107 /DNA_START=74 /DNA_END=1487 /DNA_ORIENTATION=+
MAFSRMFSSRTVGVGAAAAGAVVAAGSAAPAHALAPSQVPNHSRQVPMYQKVEGGILDEEWLLADMSPGEVLVFRPFHENDINAALSDMARNFTPSSPVTRSSVLIEEEECPSRSSETSNLSEGRDADAVLGTSLRPAGNTELGTVGAPKPGAPTQMDDLLRITGRLLRRPGLQKEVVLAMMDDSEIRELLLRQSHDLEGLEKYLASVGISSPGLLPPQAAAALQAYSLQDGYVDAEGNGDEQSPLDAILHAVRAAIGAAGGALAGMGGWLRDRFQRLGAGLAANLFGEEETEEDQKEGSEGKSAPAGARPRRRTDAVLGAVMVLAVAVMFSLVARRPMVVRRAKVGPRWRHAKCGAVPKVALYSKLHCPQGGAVPNVALHPRWRRTKRGTVLKVVLYPRVAPCQMWHCVCVTPCVVVTRAATLSWLRSRWEFARKKSGQGQVDLLLKGSTLSWFIDAQYCFLGASGLLS